MGQIFSASDAGVDRDAVRPPRGRRKRDIVVLVDLDNIAFYKGHLSEECLLSRVRAIRETLGRWGDARAGHPAFRIEYFCNPATYGFLRRVGFQPLADVRRSAANLKDSADHLLLRRFIDLSAGARPATPGGRAPTILVVTHDKTLGRLVRYAGPFASDPSSGYEDDLVFGTFGTAASSCDVLELSRAQRFNLVFNDKTDLDGFMRSLSAFQSSTQAR